MSTHKLRRVFVWQLPVRFFHWINALAIVTLCVTGYLIGKPPALQFSGEAYERYVFGWIRYIHFVAAYIFLFNFIFRIYWGFAGNKYARWKNFIPTTRKYFEEMWQVLKIDILQIKSKEHLVVGHNALAGFIYFLTFILFAIQCVTGFGLYEAMSQSWIAGMFAWVSPLFGGDFDLRQIHHITMWLFILFTIVHVHLVFYHDYVEGRGEISSMGGGWKFIEEEAFLREEEEPASNAKKVA
ncbi:MAG: Ni/Fe-hydrogenase, b-type cytochrome subunit [Saprospirales bacterium]|nr:Ni/Fe-hydrogenase, b-type cytochrome subunit [Saprospirales bacterium]MBK8923143.1 Ni/Fe-hydrogenase, b-type cytochrome subunit [Saprospirales bacterium]